MKEELYHIALDDYEHGIIIRSLNDEKTDLMNEGKSTDAVDDLIIKVGTGSSAIFPSISSFDRLLISEISTYRHAPGNRRFNITSWISQVRIRTPS